MKQVLMAGFALLILCLAGAALAAGTKSNHTFCSIELPQGWVVATDTDNNLTVGSADGSTGITASFVTMDAKFTKNFAQDMMKKFGGKELSEDNGAYSFWGSTEGEPLYISIWARDADKVFWIMEFGDFEKNKESEAVANSIIFF